MSNMSKRGVQVIGSDRRGYLAGCEEERNVQNTFPLHSWPVEEIEARAWRVLSTLRTSGYAHLDPEQEFVQGFIQGFRLSFLSKFA